VKSGIPEGRATALRYKKSVFRIRYYPQTANCKTLFYFLHYLQEATGWKISGNWPAGRKL